MNFALRIFMFGFAATAIGCTAANPEITSLATRASVSLEGLKDGVLEISSAASPLKITGRCTAVTTDIDLSHDNGTTWSSIHDYQGVRSCSETQTFEFTIENPREFAGAGVGASFQRDLRIRSRFVDGATQVAEFKLLYEDKTPLVPSLAHTPATRTRELEYEIIVSEVHSYAYKVSTSSASCSDPVGYGAVASSATPLSVSVAQDGNFRLCVVGQDQWGRKDFGNAKSHNWLVDATGPVIVFSSDLLARSPTNALPLKFLMQTSEPLHNSPLASHILQTGSATGVTWQVNPTLTVLGLLNQEFTVEATSATDGTVAPGIAAGAVADDLGNTNLAVMGHSHAITYDTTVPVPPTFLSTRASPEVGRTKTPTVVISHAEIGAEVSLFTDSACTSANKIASEVVLNLPLSVVTDTPLNNTADEETFRIYARQTDMAGNVSDCTTSFVTYQLDLVPPRITAITALSADGIYTLPTDTITIRVTTSENVLFSTNDAILVTNAAPPPPHGRGAIATRGPHSSFAQQFDFTYTLSAGDFARDLDITAISFTPGSITDAAGNSLVADLSHVATPMAQNSAITVAVPTTVTVVARYPTNGDKWNQYLRFVGYDPLAMTDSAAVACQGNGIENGPLDQPNGCLHAGERRKVHVPERTSCTGLSIEESLQAFDWQCRVIDGKTYFLSEKLKSGKGLKDLLTLDAGAGIPGWRNNRISIYDDGTSGEARVLIAQSVDAAWWNNNIAPLPETFPNQIYTLSNSESIYVIDRPMTAAGYLITGDGIAIVSLRNPANPPHSFELVYSNNAETRNCNAESTVANYITKQSQHTRPVFCVPKRKFLWFELELSGTPDLSNLNVNNAQAAIYASELAFSRIFMGRWHDFGWNTSNPRTAIDLLKPRSILIDKLDLERFGSTGISLRGGSEGALFNMIRSTHVSAGRSTESGSTGTNDMILLERNIGTRVQHISVAAQTSVSGANSGLRISESETVYVTLMRASNIQGSTSHGSGVNITGSKNISISGLLSSSNEEAGLKIASSSQNIVVTHSTLTNNTHYGVRTIGATSLLLHNLVIANSNVGIQQNQGTIRYSNTVIGETASKAIVMSSVSTAGATFEGFYSAPASSQCEGTDFFHSNCDPKGTATRLTISTAGAFVGNVSSDATNSAAVAGRSNMYINQNIWARFDNIQRLFTKFVDGRSFLDTDTRGPCVSTISADCQISDLRIYKNSSLYDRSATGTAVNASPGFHLSMPVCTGVLDPAANAKTAPLAGSSKFLAFAIEGNIGLSNGNGLCEPGEVCLYAPNLGGYQGHGDIPAASPGCVAVGGDFTMDRPTIIAPLPSNGVTPP